MPECSHGVVLPLGVAMKMRVVLAGVLGFGLASSVQAAQAAQAPLDGSTYAIATPAFDGSGGSPISSYFRFFNGNTSTSTFTVTIVGSQSGTAYGQPFTIQIPARAAPQYSLGTLLTMAGASGAGAGTANNDTSFAVFIKNPDTSAGYQHVTYNGTTTLFENNSVCNKGLLSAALLSVTNQNVLTNIHTSRLGGYPSVIYLFNSSSAALSVPVQIYDAGILGGADGRTLSTGAGALIGSTTIQIPANTTVTKNFTDLQTAVNWTPTTSQLHANLVVPQPSNSGSSVNPVILAHSIFNATLGGSINMTAGCAVNSLTSGSGSGGSSQTQKFITNASAGTTFTLAAGQITAFTITNPTALAAGTATVPTGTLQSDATASIASTASGFNFTLPDGKTVNYDLTAGAQDVHGTGEYETLTADGKNVDTKLQNGKSSTLSYSTFGTWDESATSATDGIPLNTGTLATGISTTSAQMPATGTVTYSGDIAGFGIAAAFGEIKSGTVSLSVNFAARTITGSVSNIVTQGLGENAPAGTMSNITMTGTITGTSFTITATGAAGGTPTVNIAGASGTFSGTFSGPNAAELSAAVSMTGGATVLAAFGAHQ